MPKLLARTLAPLLATGLLTTPQIADAFCGFYVAGAEADLYNNATVVVLMRDGTRTVLSMQNDYQGPPEDFALVIPVPVVLKEGDVKTLRKELFDRVDKLAAPRLVEYWEQDPCNPGFGVGGLGLSGTGRGGGGTGQGYGIGAGKFGVEVEAQFDVAEYEIVILSAKDSTGLDGWLEANDYNIPEGAEPLLRPYVQQGMKFFVAKVNVEKVRFENGRATLSPLRFHYDSPEFALPVRLGLINAPTGEQGSKQDLLIHILAPKQRYQVANYENVTIPTNLDVQDRTRDEFGRFYVSLFDHTLEQQPKAVVTEYAWSATSCDPCPETPLTSKELLELGGDVLPEQAQKLRNDSGDGRIGLGSTNNDFVLTRLHARYDASWLGEDLVFEKAPAIVGGREWPAGSDGKPEQGSRPADELESNAFQARYAIRHPWTGEIECKEPQRGVWGPNPEGEGGGKPTLARQLALQSRGAALGSFVTASAGAQLGVTVLADSPPTETKTETEIEPETKTKTEPETKTETKSEPEAKGCVCTTDEPRSPLGGLALGLLGLLGLLRVRRNEQ